MYTSLYCMYKDGLLLLEKTHINNSCCARRPVADNKNKNNDINNSYQDTWRPDQKIDNSYQTGDSEKMTT